MSHNPEQLAKIIEFPLERVRLHQLDVSFANLEKAVEQTPPNDPSPDFFRRPPEITEEGKLAENVAPLIDLDAIREAVRRAAA